MIKYFTDSDLAKQVVIPVSKYVDSDIVTYKTIDKVTKIGEGENDYKIEKAVVEVKRVNRSEFINSFAADCGILNIVKKVTDTGDKSLLNVKPGFFADLTDMPEKVADAAKGVEAGKAAAKKAGINFDEESLKKYIQAEIEKLKKVEVKENEVK